MTQEEKMAIVQSICTMASRGTDCRGLSLKGEAQKLLEEYGVSNAKICEIPLYWSDQVEILFDTEGHENCVFSLCVGKSLEDGSFLEELTVSPVAKDGYIEFENEKPLPLDYFCTEQTMDYKVRVTISNGVVMEMARLTNSTFKAILGELEFAIPKDRLHAHAEIIDIATGKTLHRIEATNFGFGNCVYAVDGKGSFTKGTYKARG